MTERERCDIPQVGTYYVVPDGAVLPDGLDPRRVFRFPVAAYCATVTARTDVDPAADAPRWAQPLALAFRKAAKGLHKLDVRAMRDRVYEWQAEGVSDDDIVLRLNRGALAPDDVDDLGG